jgi:hypothetical protein
VQPRIGHEGPRRELSMGGRHGRHASPVIFVWHLDAAWVHVHGAY